MDGAEGARASQLVRRSAKVGLFVAPTRRTSGEIETLVWRAWAAIPANADVLTCIEAYLRLHGGCGIQSPESRKGIDRESLAIRNDEDPRLGPGARANVFDLAGA